MSTINWNLIRIHHRSQQNAFEELCAQLLHIEDVPVGSSFTRVGTNDGGVEAYWTLPNGMEWAIQAKLFTSTIDWRQVDESVSRALATHPRLGRYTLCLPKNLSDARSDPKSSRRGGTEASKWNERRAAYISKAAGAGKSVDFDLWDDTELTLRLSAASNKGRVTYWFDAIHFTPDWFSEQFEVAKSIARDRYTPGLSIDTLLSDTLDALAQNSSFRERVFSLYRGIRKALQGSSRRAGSGEYEANEIDTIVSSASQILSTLEDLDRDPLAIIDWGSVRVKSGIISEALRSIRNALSRDEPNYYKDYRSEHSELRHLVSETENVIHRLQSLSHGDASAANATRHLCVVGEGGSGKTHSFCDAVARAVAAKVPAVVFFGERFRSDKRPIWQVLADQLSVKATKDELLGALDAAGEAAGTRAMLFVDALNETRDDAYWKTELADLLMSASRYANVAVAVSVRDTHIRTIVDPQGARIQPTVEHPGFRGNELEAQTLYFRTYNLASPSTPLLVPEFSNPLFLKLFCEGLEKRNLREVPRGIHGITSVFDNYLRVVEERIAERRGEDARDRNVARAVDAFVRALAERNARSLGLQEAKAIFKGYETRDLGHHKSILTLLLDEGALTEVPSEGDVAIRFTYERFADHLRARYVLDRIEAFQETTARESALRELLAGNSWDLIDALLIQIPERFGQECADLAPDIDVHYYWSASLVAMPRREPSAITDYTEDEVRKRFRVGLLSVREMDALIIMAVSSNGRLGVDWLHNELKNLSLPSRDRMWTLPLNFMDAASAAPMRIIHWALEETGGSDHSSAMQVATVLGWFFTASNRLIRDRATKALVNILGLNPGIMGDLVIAFAGCNDPYVLERILAAIYGSVLRGISARHLREVASIVANIIFIQAAPPVHLLIRDYARCILDQALSRDCLDAGIDVKTARPPYRSAPPAFPEHSSLNADHYDPDRPWGLSAVQSSLSSHGDFSRYILHTDFASGFHWIDVPLNEPLPLTRRAAERQFEEALSEEEYSAFLVAQKAAFLPYLEALQGKSSKSSKRDPLAQFLEKLNRKQRALYRLRERATHNLPEFDLRRAADWIYERVLSMGYDAEALDEYERVARFDRGSRGEEHRERIGKKYQWIAYAELLARLADNYHVRPDDSSGYETPVNLGVRDIDPSSLIQNTKSVQYEQHDINWWAPEAYSPWDRPLDYNAWVRAADYPDLSNNIFVYNSHQEWVTLLGNYSWYKPGSRLRGKWDEPTPRYVGNVVAYLLPADRVDQAFTFLRHRDLRRIRLEDMPQIYRLFIGEYANSPASSEYFRHRKLAPYSSQAPVTDLLVPAAAYISQEHAPDFSNDEAWTIAVPSDVIIRELDLKFSPESGWRSSAGDILAFDPSVNDPGAQAVLIRKDALARLMEGGRWNVIWIINGEKQIVGGRTMGRPTGSLEIQGVYRLTNDFRLEGGSTRRRCE
jgi:hypothetical protein